MAENSAIEWTDHTFNPWVGCTKVSPGCDHCYAESWAKRSGQVKWGDSPRRRTSWANWGLPLKWNARAAAEGRRYRVFCASLADVFDNQVPWQWRDDLLDLIQRTPYLDWLLLTKRIGNVAAMLEECGRDELPSNVWLGATVVNQEEADRDIPKLFAAPARVRFVSVEPLLGPVDLHKYLILQCDRGSVPGPGGVGGVMCPHCEGNVLLGCDLLNWVIVGGESGAGARPMHPDWARSLRDQCEAAGVPFLFKQWGEWKPICQGDGDWYDSLYAPRVTARLGEDQDTLNDIYGRRCKVPELILRIAGDHAGIGQPLAFESGARAVQAFKVGKKAAGRLLDGRTYDEFPEVR